jgi:tetratricopeptide (TPR) repeat protein
MPDATRDNLLREAAAFARRGKLDQAVRQYEAALELSPDDWSTANLIGDLWLKLNEATAAKRYFDTAANRLADEGFHAKASALFKKILKIWPDDDNARVRAAEIAETQELYADSDAHYRAASAARRARGDVEGARVLEERLRVRAPEEGAGARESGATPVPVAPVSPGASERWASSVMLSLERIIELVTGLEIADPPPAALASVDPYTTGSWGPDLAAQVVGSLDGIDPAADVAAFDSAEMLAGLGVRGDGWRELVRKGVRPEWVEALEARQRSEAERAADPPVAAAAEEPERAPEPAEPIVVLEAVPAFEEPVAAFETTPAYQAPPAVESAPLAESEPAAPESAPAVEPRPVAAHAAIERPDVADITLVFDYLRATFAAAHTMQARDWLVRGRAWLASGDAAAGIPALERATSASTVRGEAATALGRHYLHARNPATAVQWLERAAECPTDDERAGQALVYDIGCALQDLGEDLRALAVFTELRRAAGGSWADVNERIDRLSGLA